jgi:hypothetical protein
MDWRKAPINFVTVAISQLVMKTCNLLNGSMVSCTYCFATKSEEKERQRQFETWGVVGGPDKGRSPKRLDANHAAGAQDLPNSI